MPERVFVGLDFGTSGARAVAIDLGGSLLATARCALPASQRGPAGESEQDPQRWRDAAVALLCEIVAALPTHRVAAIAVDGTSSTVLLCDAEGTALTCALMYDDARARTQLNEIAAAAPLYTAVHSATSSLAKLLWWRQHLPRQLWDASAIRHQADWIGGWLAGDFRWGDENNALKLGYDAVARCWPDWLRQLGLRARLPLAVSPGSRVGAVAAAVAAQTGLPPDCRIVAGTTDSTAAVLAVGVSEAGQAVTSLGSTLVVKVWSAAPVFASQYGVYSHRVDDRWLVGGASNSGGAVLAHYFSHERLAELTQQLDPDCSTGLDYYPLLRPGERFPSNDPDFPPRLTPRPSSDVEFFQAMLEGMARIEQCGYQRLAALGASIPTMVWSIGGGAANAPWRKIRERLLGVPVRWAAHQEAAYGAALLARRAAL